MYFLFEERGILYRLEKKSYPLKAADFAGQGLMAGSAVPSPTKKLAICLHRYITWMVDFSSKFKDIDRKPNWYKRCLSRTIGIPQYAIMDSGEFPGLRVDCLNVQVLFDTIRQLAFFLYNPICFPQPLPPRPTAASISRRFPGFSHIHGTPIPPQRSCPENL